MALHIVDKKPNFAQALNTGLSSGVNALAQHKLGEINQNKLSNMFQSLNYSPEQSNLLAYFQQQDPEQFSKIFPLIAGAGDSARNNPIIAQQRLELQKQRDLHKKELNYDKLVDNLHHLTTAKDKLNSLSDLLDKGIQSGFVSSKKAQYLGPQANNQNTEDFAKLADEYFSLASDNAKGIQNMYRIKIRQNAKPSIAHSDAVNRRAIDDARREVDARINTFKRLHPEVAQLFNEEQQALQGQMPQQQMPMQNLGQTETLTQGMNQSQQLMQQPQIQQQQMQQQAPQVQPQEIYIDDNGRIFVDGRDETGTELGNFILSVAMRERK